MTLQMFWSREISQNSPSDKESDGMGLQWASPELPYEALAEKADGTLKE